MTPRVGNEIAISLYTYWPLMAPSMVAFGDRCLQGLSKSRTSGVPGGYPKDEEDQRKSRPLAPLPTWGLCFWS